MNIINPVKDDIELFIELNKKISEFYYSEDTFIDININVNYGDDKLLLLKQLESKLLIPKEFAYSEINHGDRLKFEDWITLEGNCRFINIRIIEA